MIKNLVCAFLILVSPLAYATNAPDPAAQAVIPAATPVVPAPTNDAAALGLPTPAAVVNPDEKQPPEFFVNKASDALKQKKYKDALAALDTAKQKVSAIRLEAAKQLFPQTPNGWEAKPDPDTASDELASAMLGGLLGGMSLADRTYTSKGHELNMSIILDSALMKMASGMVELGGKAVSDKMTKVKGYGSIYKEDRDDPKAPENSLIVYAGEVIVTFKSATLGKDVLTAFANLVDFDKFNSLN